jgi:hypothetical protein
MTKEEFIRWYCGDRAEFRADLELLLFAERSLLLSQAGVPTDEEEKATTAIAQKYYCEQARFTDFENAAEEAMITMRDRMPGLIEKQRQEHDREMEAFALWAYINFRPISNKRWIAKYEQVRQFGDHAYTYAQLPTKFREREKGKQVNAPKCSHCKDLGQYNGSACPWCNPGGEWASSIKPEHL